MNGGDRFSDDERALAELGEALGCDPHRAPPPSRVQAVREAAEQLRSQQPEDRTAPGTVTRMPQRRQLLLGGIAASFGALAGYGGRELLGTDPTAPTAAPNPPTEAIAFAGAPRGVQTSGRLINHSWGTELMLEVSGFPAGQAYGVVYQRAGGSTQAGSFRSVGATVAKCRFNASTLRAKLTAIVVVDSDGTEVLRADLA